MNAAAMTGTIEKANKNHLSLTLSLFFFFSLFIYFFFNRQKIDTPGSPATAFIHFGTGFLPNFWNMDALVRPRFGQISLPISVKN